MKLFLVVVSVLLPMTSMAQATCPVSYEEPIIVREISSEDASRVTDLNFSGGGLLNKDGNNITTVRLRNIRYDLKV